MKILGIDTATNWSSLGLVEGEKLLAEWLVKSKMTQIMKVMPGIKSILEEMEMGLKDLDGISVTVGPGSFTGVRLGLVTAKTLCQVTGLKLAGINSLEALVFQSFLRKGFVVPIVDARRKQVYSGFYRKEEDKIVEYSEAGLYYPEELAEKLNQIEEELFIIGEVNHDYRKAFTEKLKVPYYWLPSVSSVIKGSTVAILGSKKLEKGNADNYLELLPLYIRPPDAKISKKSIFD